MSVTFLRFPHWKCGITSGSREGMFVSGDGLGPGGLQPSNSSSWQGEGRGDASAATLHLSVGLRHLLGVSGQDLDKKKE